MAFNPITQHRRVTGRFENDKVSREQQENKALQRMIRAGGRVYTRSHATPITTGQAVATTLALGTLGLMAGSVLQAAPVQDGASPLRSCVSNMPLPAAHGKVVHHLQSNCMTRDMIYVRSGCRLVEDPAPHVLEAGQAMSITTKSGAELAGCEAPFRRTAEPTQPVRQLTRCLSDYTSDWGSQATKHRLVNGCVHKTSIYVKPECRTNDYQPKKYYLSRIGENKDLITKNGAALSTCAKPFIAAADTALDGCISDKIQSFTHSAASHRLQNNCATEKTIYVKSGCEYSSNLGPHTLNSAATVDISTKTGETLAGCEAPFSHTSDLAKPLKKVTTCLTDDAIAWGSQATMHRLVNDCNHEVKIFLKPECRTHEQQATEDTLPDINGRASILTKNGDTLDSCENPFIESPTYFVAATVNECVTDYRTSFASGADEHDLENERCWESSEVKVKTECMLDDEQSSMHTLPYNQAKNVYTKSEAAQSGCGQPFEDPHSSSASSPALQIKAENIGECFELHLQKTIPPSTAGRGVLDFPHSGKVRGTVRHSLHNTNEHHRIVYVRSGCELEGSAKSHRIEGWRGVSITTKSGEVLAGCETPFSLLPEQQEPPVQVTSCLTDSPLAWGSKATKHKLLNKCELKTAIFIKPECRTEDNQQIKYYIPAKGHGEIITKNAATQAECDISFVNTPTELPPQVVNACVNDYPTFFGSHIDQHTLANDNCWHSSQVMVKNECLVDEYQSPLHILNTNEVEEIYTKSSVAEQGCSQPFVTQNSTSLDKDHELNFKNKVKVEPDKKYNKISYKNRCKNSVKISWDSVDRKEHNELLASANSEGVHRDDFYVNKASLRVNDGIFDLTIIDSAEALNLPNPYSKGAFIRTNTLTAESSLLFLRRYTSMLKAMPDPMRVASQTVKKALVAAGHANIDPDRVFYHRFTNARNDRKTLSGWRHHGPPVHSYSLTQAAMLQAYDEFYDDLLAMNSQVGIYKFGYQDLQHREWWDANGEANLLGTQFANAMRNIDVQGDYTKALNTFWAKNTQMYTAMLRDGFQIAANNQRQTGRMTESQYLLAMSVLTKRSSVSCYKLDVYGYQSKDILLIESRRGRGGLLYMPGSSPAFTPYTSRTELKHKIITQIKNQHNRERLESHFSLYNRQDGTSYSGVDSALKGLADATWDESYLMQKLVSMPEDIFAQVTEDTKATMVSDGDTSIKSNAEAKRDYFLATANAMMYYLPVFDVILPQVMIPAGIGLMAGQFGASLDKAINGDTQDERMEGTYASAFNGALLGATLLIPAMVKAASALDSSLEQAESALLSAKTETSDAAETEVNQGISLQTMSGFTSTPTQLIHPRTTQVLLGVELANSKEKVLLRALGNNQYAKMQPTTGERLGTGFVYKAMDPTTGEAQWLEGGGLKGGVLPDGEQIVTTWGASAEETASMGGVSAPESQREILFLDDVQSSGNGYPDMSGAGVPEELAKLELRARVDPQSIIPDPEVLKEYSSEAVREASENSWRNNYQQQFANKVVYRGDGRLPDELFYSGFIRRPIPIKRVDIAGGEGIMGVVSTTTDDKIALKYAKHQTPGGYVYAAKLKDGGVPIDSVTLRGEPLSEIAVLNVPPEDVMFAIGPFDTVRTTLKHIKGLDSIELRLNPYSTATYEQAKEAYDALKGQLSSVLFEDEAISFHDRWESRRDLLFHEKDADVYIKEKLDVIEALEAFKHLPQGF